MRTVPTTALALRAVVSDRRRKAALRRTGQCQIMIFAPTASSPCAAATASGGVDPRATSTPWAVSRATVCATRRRKEGTRFLGVLVAPADVSGGK